MSAGERRRYEVRDKQGAQWIGSLVAGLEPGWVVTIAPAGRSLDQNAIFHKLCDDIAKALPEWNGMSMAADDWKQLLILSHAMATDGSGVRLVKDLEGSGLVQLRESSARMSKSRATSLIEYCLAFAAQRGIPLRETTP
jgi:hypothetical protein